MANFNLSGLSNAIDMRSKSVTYKPTTTTPVITPIFSGDTRVTGTYSSLNYQLTGLGNSVDAYTPGRPGGGQLFPRGNQ